MRSAKEQKDPDSDESLQETTPADDTSVSADESSVVPVSFRNKTSASAPEPRMRSYRNYRGGRPGVRYQYEYRRRPPSSYRQPYYARPGRAFYYRVPVYYYGYGVPGFSYYPGPYFYSYGPGVRVYVGPRFYWY